MKDNHMQVLKPGEMVFDELANDPQLHQMIDALCDNDVIEYKVGDVVGGRRLDKLDALCMQIGQGQVPMRRKQGVFRPKKLAVIIALAFRIPPPPALVVRFDNNGIKTTFPAAFDTV